MIVVFHESDYINDLNEYLVISPVIMFLSFLDLGHVLMNKENYFKNLYK